MLRSRSMSPVTSPKIRRYYDLLEDDPMRRYADFDERRLFRREEAEILRIVADGIGAALPPFRS